MSAGAAPAAVTLPPATFSSVCIDLVPFAESGGPGQAGCSVPDASATGTIKPFATAEAKVADAGSDFTQQVQVTVQYAFTIEGGTPGTVLPMDVSSNLVSSGLPGGGPVGYARAGLVVDLNGGNTVFADVCTDGTCDNGSEFHGTLPFAAADGGLYRISIQAVAEGVGLGSSAFARVDPKIFVDPSAPNAGSYQVVLSSGVVNGLPVPEPSAWGLLLAGLASLGPALRRRRVPG
jgi:hypothetical protein